MIAEFLRKIGYYVHRRRFEAELDEEMRHHLSMAGRAQFGNVTHWKEECRDIWAWALLEQFMQDLRYAVRAMNRNRAFTALAAVSLALGIGSNTAIFSFMDAILLRSLPVKDPESLAMINWHIKGAPFTSGLAASIVIHTMSGSIYEEPNSGSTAAILPYPAFEVLQRNSSSVFASVFAFCSAGRLNLSIRRQADIAAAEFVSGDYFRGLGIPPAAGRLLLADDDRAGAPAVAVVSYALSQTRFGGAANAVGSPILINNVPFTVVGVTPPEFFGVSPGEAPDVYIPLHTNLLLVQNGFQVSAAMYLDQNFYWIETMARLQPGVSLEQARAGWTVP